MSTFLGPIHFMMFEKIKIAAGRNMATIEAFKKAGGTEAEETINAALPDGAVDFGDTALEELVGSSPIHQFIQSLIDRVEVAEATVVTALLYRFPDTAEELLKKTYEQHGKESAIKYAAANGNGSIDEMINGMNRFYLEGMPCDAAYSYSQSGGGLQIEYSECLHKPKWDSVGAPAETMCELLNQWKSGFFAAINSSASLKQEQCIAGGDNKCRLVITI